MADGLELEEVWNRIDEIRERRKDLADARHIHVAKDYAARETRGERIADGFAATVGSWPFIIGQSGLLAVWVLLNAFAWIRHWDPYPFILLNLMLSFQAAYAGPIIMMSQNRSSGLDRGHADADYRVNQKAELEIEEILILLDTHTHLLAGIRERLTGDQPS